MTCSFGSVIVTSRPDVAPYTYVVAVTPSARTSRVARPSRSRSQRVRLLQEHERITLDVRRKGKLLALEVAARITSADQKCFEIPGVEDEGLDMEVEFTDDEGRGTGKRIFLQLKAGNSHLERRKRDNAEIFRIKKQSWVDYWMKQNCPVVLVVGTFPEDADAFRIRPRSPSASTSRS